MARGTLRDDVLRREVKEGELPGTTSVTTHVLPFTF
jgi:hypothetical protein